MEEEDTAVPEQDGAEQEEGQTAEGGRADSAPTATTTEGQQDVSTKEASPDQPTMEDEPEDDATTPLAVAPSSPPHHPSAPSEEPTATEDAATPKPAPAPALASPPPAAAEQSSSIPSPPPPPSSAAAEMDASSPAEPSSDVSPMKKISLIASSPAPNRGDEAEEEGMDGGGGGIGMLGLGGYGSSDEDEGGDERMGNGEEKAPEVEVDMSEEREKGGSFVSLSVSLGRLSSRADTD